MKPQRVLVISIASALSIAIAAAASGSARSASGLCAFREATARNGLTATAVLHVVQNGCQLSMLSISKFADGNSVYDTATKTFDASDERVTLSVQLPCGVGSETDVVLGPPTLYPPGDLDLGATSFDVACPAGGGGSTGGGGSGGGGGGGGGGSGGGGSGGGGGAGATALPDLATTVTSTRTTAVRVGDVVPVTVTIKNLGTAGAGGVHALVSFSPNTISHGATASRGPGCTGVAVLDCDLGSLAAGSSTTVQLKVSAEEKGKLFVGAQVQEIENDSALSNNAGTFTLPALAKLRPLKIVAVPSRIVAHDQLVYLQLTRAASVTAQVYVGGKPRPIGWRRSLRPGTVIVRIPLPSLNHGQRFMLMFRAKSASATASARLQLHM